MKKSQVVKVEMQIKIIMKEKWSIQRLKKKKKKERLIIHEEEAQKERETLRIQKEEEANY